MKFLLSALILLVSSNLGVQAATIKVAQAGVRDFSTIGAALMAAQAGDTILVGPGLYDETLVVYQDVIIKGAGPQYVTIRAEPNKDTFLVGDPFGTSPLNFTISGVTITSGDHSGMIIYAGANTILQNCVVADCRENGIFYNNNNGQSSSAHSEVAAYNCTFANNGNWAIHYASWNNGIVRMDDSIFANNNEKDSNNAQTYVYTSGNAGLNTPVIIGRYLIFGKNLLMVPSGAYVVANAPYAGLAANPLFVNSTNGNYTLKTTGSPKSPAINAGAPGLAKMDPDGTVCDLGAYGGPEAKSFWPYPPGGPFIKTLTLEPNSVARGGKITVKATATTQ